MDMRAIVPALVGWLAWGGTVEASAKASVVGGRAVGISEAPWTMVVNVGCTGSWIGGRWAITAAHCREGHIGWVTAGITRRMEVNTAPRTKVKRIIMDEKTDILLLELDADITAVKARPIHPATVADAAAGLASPGKLARMYGWGKLGMELEGPDSLHMLEQKIADVTPTDPHYIRYGGAEGDTLEGPCHGDSGGPLAVRDATGTSWILAGVVSHGSDICGDAEPDYFGRVSSVESWIRAHTGNSVQVFPVSPPRITRLNRIRISRSERLDITFLDLAGALARRSGGVYPAGDHAMPVVGLAPGNYLVRVKGERLEMRGRVLIQP